MSLSGLGSIQERLTFAALPLTILNTPSNENPDDIREELGAIVQRLTVKPLSNEVGYVPRELSDDEANKIAQNIVSLFARAMGGL
jgi:hypothetical protein